MLDIRQIESFYPENLRFFKKNLLREYLQYKILEAIFSSEFGNFLNFMGGTAIHVLHGNTRFSEDLDFDNLGLDFGKFEKLVSFVKNKLSREGYVIETKNVSKGAYTAHLKMPRLLYDSGLSNHEEEVLLIKVDAEPQKFKYKATKNIINKFDVFTRISAVPIDILLSQKIYTIFKRKRPMGRDFYDAIFLFGKTRSNLGYLRTKLGVKNKDDLKDRLLRRCSNLNFKQLAQDVEPFLFHPDDSKKVLLFPDYIQDNKF